MRGSSSFTQAHSQEGTQGEHSEVVDQHIVSCGDDAYCEDSQGGGVGLVRTVRATDHDRSHNHGDNANQPEHETNQAKVVQNTKVVIVRLASGERSRSDNVSRVSSSMAKPWTRCDVIQDPAPDDGSSFC